MKTILTGFLILLLNAPVRAWENRKFAASVTVPTTGWRLKIASIYKVKNALWVIAQLTPPAGLAGDALTSAADEISINAPSGEAKYFILGKDWNWRNQEPYEFIPSSDIAGFLEKLNRRKDKKLIWSDTAKSKHPTHNHSPDRPAAQ
ncbi:MAG: hypothetical protein UY62_C0091G0003 [Parcubacteria group bacterium GW2011_GWF2_50_9]|nr:MAG: hypothetical protein UY62_C0091G0003 [Parcubacteria group bacterium GW2011_GWF2_50_9]